MMTSKKYTEQTSYAFVPTHNLSNYPPTIGTVQGQVLRTESFWQNQALFRRYTDVERSLKNQIVTAVQPVFLYPLLELLTVFGQVSVLNMLQQLFTPYKEIDKIDLEKNAVKIMEPYYPVEPLARLIKKLEKGR